MKPESKQTTIARRSYTSCRPDPNLVKKTTSIGARNTAVSYPISYVVIITTGQENDSTHGVNISTFNQSQIPERQPIAHSSPSVTCNHLPLPPATHGPGNALPCAERRAPSVTRRRPDKARARRASGAHTSAPRPRFAHGAALARLARDGRQRAVESHSPLVWDRARWSSSARTEDLSVAKLWDSSSTINRESRPSTATSLDLRPSGTGAHWPLTHADFIAWRGSRFRTEEGGPTRKFSNTTINHSRATQCHSVYRLILCESNFAGVKNICRKFTYAPAAGAACGSSAGSSARGGAGSNTSSSARITAGSSARSNAGRCASSTADSSATKSSACSIRITRRYSIDRMILRGSISFRYVSICRKMELCHNKFTLRRKCVFLAILCEVFLFAFI